MMTSVVWLSGVLIQCRERIPGWYGEASRFATTPSSPCAAAVRIRSVPASSADHGGVLTTSSSRPSACRWWRRSVYGASTRPRASRCSTSNRYSCTGTRSSSAGLGALTCIRCWSRLKLGRPFGSRATISPSRMTCRRPARSIRARSSRVGVGDVAVVARGHPQLSPVEGDDRAYAVPLELVPPAGSRR
jgi:hypothetical protein